MMDVSKLGEILRALRVRRGLKQRELADALGVNRSSYAMYEVGVRVIPLEKLVSLAAYYHMTLDEIVSFDADKPDDDSAEPPDETSGIIFRKTENLSSADPEADARQRCSMLAEENRRLKDELLILYRRQIKLYRRIEILSGTGSSHSE